MARRLPFVFALLLLPLVAGAVPTRHNDDSCDISVLPAATLLLPYFEVGIDDQLGETTLFTITNVTNLEQIANVTLWTDSAFPVFSFNIYLTGYDVQAINLFDVIAHGVVAPLQGTGTQLGTSRRGTFSDPNRALDLSACGRLPGSLDPIDVERMQDAFTLGVIDGASCREIGGVHANAAGYATIDVVGRCEAAMATDAHYWTDVIRYDNVLTGDYQQINSTTEFAQGGPMVHIRAVPEGGTPEERARLVKYDAGFTRTFYSAFQSAATPHLDGRQPLPAQFAARWIAGADTGTSLKIWREGTRGALCPEPQFAPREIVTFDENENATAHASPILGRFPLTSKTSVTSPLFPQPANGASSGWMYLNLDRSGEAGAQAWVITSMHAQGRFSTDSDATALGNGCSARIRHSEIARAGGVEIGPAPNRSPRSGTASTNNDDNCDIALLPAATLLLPYFEVDLDPPPFNGEDTLFTIANVAAEEQIARVTLWTDYAFPVITFNVYLTGYDVQSISVRDLLHRGVTGPAETGARVSPRGRYSDPNPALARSGCAVVPHQLPPEWIQRMQDAFTLGRVADLGAVEGCDEVGNVHDNAVGYATIDVVRNCSLNDPLSPDYWSEDVAFDNVLTGDYQQLDRVHGIARSSPMVHVRAVPEGGTAEDRARDSRYETPFPYTFYSRFQSSRTPRLDGRQPLPSTFAARWIQGSSRGYETSFKVWRQANSGRETRCGEFVNAVMEAPDVVRFDEQENGVARIITNRVTPIARIFTLPATSRTSVADVSFYPSNPLGAVSGWMYFNLDSGPGTSGAQNWLVVSMRVPGRYSVDIDGAALGNGCSPPAPKSEILLPGGAVIGPAPNRNP